MTELFQTSPEQLRIDIWSDIICPFCYIGEATLAQALEEFPHPVQVVYHSYQLAPDFPDDLAENPAAMLHRTKGIPLAQAQAMNEQVTERAAAVGLEYRLDIAQTVNTNRAHQLSHFALAESKQRELMQELFAAYFTHGKNLNDVEELVRIAAQVGLSAEAARAILTEGTYRELVTADIAAAQQLGISGVPFFVFDGHLGVSGAQPVGVFRQALSQAWEQK